MLTYLFYFILNLSFAQSSILLELGEEYAVPKTPQKIWIENEKIVQAFNSGNKVSLKARSIGSSFARFDQMSQKIIVVPINMKASVKAWNQYSYQLPHASIGFENDLPCLKGRLSSLQEFLKIMRLAEKNEMFMYLCLSAKPDLQKEIQKWYAPQFRSADLPVYKIDFNGLWKFYVSQKDLALIHRQRPFWGLTVIGSKNQIEFSENVQIEVHITEVKKEFSRSLGLGWPSEFQAQLFGSDKSEIKSFENQIKAFERNGDMKIIASPRLISKSGQQSQFFAGGEFPMITLAGKENRQMINWKKYGITLNFKPLINSVGQMSLAIETEVSTIDKSKEVQGIPALLTHKVNSFFDLVESKTIALSGLIKNESGLSNSGLPFLKNLPLLGKLFSSEDFLENKSELVIFVTPQRMEP